MQRRWSGEIWRNVNYYYHLGGCVYYQRIIVSVGRISLYANQEINYYRTKYQFQILIMVVFAFSVQEVVKKSSGHSGLQRVRERETSIIRKYTNTLSSRYYNTSMLSKCVGVFLSEVLGTYKYKFRLTRTRLRSFLIKKNSLQRAAATFVFLLF